MANTTNYGQIYTLLNAIAQIATGQTQQTVVDTGTFTAVAATTLRTGTEQVLSAISQVLSKTIFSIRPYQARFKGLLKDEIAWGNHVRKINAIDIPMDNDDRYLITDNETLKDGTAVDPYIIKKPQVVQTNFYGYDGYQAQRTIFRDQLNTAFEGPGQLGSFLSLVMQNVDDQLEQSREVLKRGALANFIAMKILMQSSAYEPTKTHVVYLLDEYNAATGGSYTSTTIMQPDNFPAFAKWMYGRVNSLSNLMQERSVIYHTAVAGKEIQRHTPTSYQHLYLRTDFNSALTSRVLADTFHDTFLTFGDMEAVSYWQSINNPGTVMAKPSFMIPANGGASFATSSSQRNVTANNVIGLIFDDEAIGVNLHTQWSAPSPFNPRGGYTNMFWHESARWWNDQTENAIVLMLSASDVTIATL